MHPSIQPPTPTHTSAAAFYQEPRYAIYRFYNGSKEHVQTCLSERMAHYVAATLQHSASGHDAWYVVEAY